MKKCVIIPDSYKETLSAINVCEIMKRAVIKHFPECKVLALPIADGGEGTVDAFLYALGVGKTFVDTTGPYNEKIKAYYAKIKDRAIMEIASVAGMNLAMGKLNPMETTSYGLGALIKDALKNNCKEIIIGLGGSCTIDGGVGLACSLGTVFYDKFEEAFIPSPKTFKDISHIDNSRTLELLKDVKITAMCDVKNPLCGNNGAAKIYGPQKGATDQMIIELEESLKHLALIMKKTLNVDVMDKESAGAAGGLGAGILGFLNGTLKPGVETILDFIQFDALIKDTDLIFTGEGRIDSQTMNGKVVYGVATRAKQKNIPVIAVCGAIGDINDEIYNLGVSAIFAISRQLSDLNIAKKMSSQNLEKTMNNILLLYKLGGSNENLR